MNHLTNNNFIHLLKISLLLVFCIFSVQLSAKETTTFTFPKSIANEEALIPSLSNVYEIVVSTNGDLNKDDLMDLVVVVADKSENADFDAPVYLGIYFKNSNGSYDLNVVSTTAVLCLQCGGAFGNPFSGIDITPKGILQIHHYGGSSSRWAYLDKYRFQNGAFYLIGSSYTESNTFSLAHKTIDTNLITGDQETIVDPGEEAKNKKVKKSRKKVTVKPLKTIDIYSPGSML